MQTAHIASIMLALNAGKKIELSGSSRWRRCPYILLANNASKVFPDLAPFEDVPALSREKEAAYAFRGGRSGNLGRAA
jgi:hypothetical protein